MNRVFIFFPLLLVGLMQFSCSSSDPMIEHQRIVREVQSEDEKMRAVTTVEGTRRRMAKLFPTVEEVPAVYKIYETSDTYDLIFPFDIDVDASGDGSWCTVIVQKREPHSRVVEYFDYIKSRDGLPGRGPLRDIHETRGLLGSEHQEKRNWKN